MSRIYIFQIFIVLLYVVSIFQIIKPSHKNIYMTIIVLSSGIVFLTLDENVPDLINYKLMYYYSSTTIEKGYLLLGEVFKKCGLNFFEFRIILGMIVVYLLYRGFSKLNSYPAIVFLCYMQYNFLEKPYIQIRNAISIAIFLNIIELFIKKKKIKGLIGIWIANLFHRTAILYLIILFFRNIKLTYKKILGYFILIILSSILITKIDLNIFFNMLLKLPFKSITEKIIYHFIEKKSQTEEVVNGSGIRMWISYFLFLLSFRYLLNEIKNKKNYKWKASSCIYLFQGIVVLVKSLSYKFLIFTRVVGCFDFAEVVIMSWLIEKQKSNLKKQIYLFVIFLYVLVSSYKFGANLGIW